VELERFTPVSEFHKERLRRCHDVPLDAFVVLHVGHINASRGIHLLEEIQGQGDVQVVLVGSTSTPHDVELSQQLERAGIIVRREYIEDIQEIYQLSDCYLFQVSSEQAAIELPLSVLEAMACNLPIITTRYGALGDLFPEGDGLVFAQTPEEVLTALCALKRDHLHPQTRRLVQAFSWENVIKTHWRSFML
jgi:glycosyltransferase involved in cell wall biosynthesis